MSVNNQNTNSHNQLVAGSNPAEPTTEANFTQTDVNSFQKAACSTRSFSTILQLHELLYILLGNRKRRLINIMIGRI